jgi:FlaA1/EpsC-like NDP-sugar epimerase
MDRAVPLRPARCVAITLDALVVVAAYLGALVLRFGGDVPVRYSARFAAFVPLIASAYVVLGLLYGVYAPEGRMLRVYAASLLSALLVTVSIVLMDRPIPFSVTILGGFGSLVGLVGWRMVAEAWGRRAERSR